ncbi:hypothetical protein BRD00_09280 [Halobacteriales archaeon QS_8_69_26]|nr:MAG: hypothetical protein BRD00_09280 [Halobacteriales archaeon QS_8_69_26]
MRGVRAAVVVLTLALLAVPVLAHVPTFPSENTSPDRAVEPHDPVKSWSFYDRVGPGEVTYYRVTLSAGERLRVGTFTPKSGPFTPSVVLMSPSLNGTEDVPARVTVPEGMGAVVVPGERPDSPGYEPFAPSADYRTVGIDRPVEERTTYLIAVFEPVNRSGPVGVSIGYREAFTPTEYATVPFTLVRTHLWAGQHLLVVLGPYLLALVAGAAFVRGRRRADWDARPVRYVAATGGILVLGTAVGTLVQMGIALWAAGPTLAALVTAAFVLVPAVAGGWALSVALRDEMTLPLRTRIGLLVAGLAAVATWAGYLLGPALLAAVAATPPGLVEE